MIQQTFLHLPGVGKHLQHGCGQPGSASGMTSGMLSAGRSPFDALRGYRQKVLFAVSEGNASDPRADLWLDCLDQSRSALRAKEYHYFLELLRPSDHWRLLGSTLKEALYLDIETTGLSADLHYVTVVGALYRGKFRQWTWPEPLDELKTLVNAAPTGGHVQRPAIRRPFFEGQGTPARAPRAHVDLLYIARAAGLAGGQKAVEEKLGLVRDDDVRGIDGAEAVGSWCMPGMVTRKAIRGCFATTEPTWR